MSYTPILPNPIEWDEQEQERCKRCDTDILTPEEVEEKHCFECMEEMEIEDENTNFKNL
tara:strand:+ start:220 stop:396 length:177 start_codon:yes stop_codon:yes gene_type:complete